MSQDLDKAIATLGSLSKADLLELKRTIDELLAVTYNKNKVSKIQGYVEHKMIPDKKRGKAYGPYKYLRVWKDGKLTSKYLGKADEEEDPNS